MIELSSTDRRAFVAAIVAAAMAPNWRQDQIRESQEVAAQRLARCAVVIANEIVNALEPATFPAGVPVSNRHWYETQF